MLDLRPFSTEKITQPLMKLSNDLQSRFFNDFMDYNELGFKTDVKEEGNNYLIQAELPGFKKENINLEIVNDYLIISAINENSFDEESNKYILKERMQGRFQRNFHLQNIQIDSIEANYDNGILEVTLPKTDNSIDKRINININ